MTPDANPFAPPATTDRDPPVASTAAEAIRERYIRHETSVRSISLLYFIGGAVLLLGSLSFLLTSVDPTDQLWTAAATTAVAGIIVISAYWLRRLDPRCRGPVTFLSVIGLLNVPVGTLVSVYILWLIWSRAGRYVFTAEYAEIRAQTPHVRYRSSTLMVVLTLLLVSILASALVYVVAST